jgi:hypothetical protein
LDLQETSCQVRKLDPATPGEQTMDFTVPPTTFALSYASQQMEAGSNPLYPSTLFTGGLSTEQNLKRLRLSYAGQTQPINETLEYKAGYDYMTKLYSDMLINSNAFSDTQGVGESKKDWVKRGIMVHYPFEKASNDGSTRVSLQVTLDSGAVPMNAILFAHYRQVAKITYRNRRVESVQVDYV